MLDTSAASRLIKNSFTAGCSPRSRANSVSYTQNVSAASSASTVAERLASSPTSAISPKLSPGPRTAIVAWSPTGVMTHSFSGRHLGLAGRPD